MTALAVPTSTQRELRTMSTSDLRAELAKSLEVTATHLVHLAEVWRELESRGEDLSALRSGLWSYMPLIASGKLDPQMVVQYAGHSLLLRRLADLSREDQQLLLTDPTVLVTEYTDGAWEERRLPITHLRASQIGQVLSGGIRPPEEQKRLALARAKRAPPKRRPRVSTDTVIEIAQNEGGLRAPRGQADGLSLSIPMSAAEREQIEALAKDNGVAVSRLVRAALVIVGLATERSRDDQ
jgi:hypothetical protein